MGWKATIFIKSSLLMTLEMFNQRLMKRQKAVGVESVYHRNAIVTWEITPKESV